MPIATTGKVLVSGANGFLAVWVVRAFLENGYAVRGAVRSADKGVHLSKIFKDYGEKFEVVEVPDITKEGAFDEAVKGVDAIAHTASPYHFKADDPAELLEPAIKGTVGMLESARRCGTAVKRIVVTSSTAAVLHDEPTPQTFTEADWDDQAVENVQRDGRNASNVHKYRASKTLAERAAWDFVKTHGSSLKWDLTVLNPPLILGPILHEVSSPSLLNTSALQMYNTYTTPDFVAGGGCWVDVRDIALAHVLAVKKEAAGGERIIISREAFWWQDWLDATPEAAKSNPRYQKGKPGSQKDVIPPVSYDASKSVRILGIKYRDMEETARDVVSDYEERGW
ncbi:D-lactaldehyde dehydrogenase [Favolaschia claudopus]|uniref:D-lactaldehyde dehydrogenase n=1 Tax=Favolaschia claudopus TaxID=2862362 RepID=A0AAW0AMS1_9AGAR